MRGFTEKLIVLWLGALLGCSGNLNFGDDRDGGPGTEPPDAAARPDAGPPDTGIPPVDAGLCVDVQEPPFPVAWPAARTAQAYADVFLVEEARAFNCGRVCHGLNVNPARKEPPLIPADLSELDTNLDQALDGLWEATIPRARPDGSSVSDLVWVHSQGQGGISPLYNAGHLSWLADYEARIDACRWAEIAARHRDQGRCPEDAGADADAGIADAAPTDAAAPVDAGAADPGALCECPLTVTVPLQHCEAF